MKKIILLILTLSLLLTGCIVVEFEEDISANGSYEVEEGQGSYEETRDKVEENVVDKLEVTEYSYSNSHTENYAFLVIKNNSDKELYIEAEVRFYDENGTIVGATDNLVSPVAGGAEAILDFMCDEVFATFEYEIEASKSEYESVVEELSLVATPAKEKEIVAITNNGSHDALWVRVDALFFNGEEVVGYGYTYISDDAALEPGDTSAQEIECYEKYTSVKFFIRGEK